MGCFGTTDIEVLVLCPGRDFLEREACPARGCGVAGRPLADFEAKPVELCLRWDCLALQAVDKISLTDAAVLLWLDQADGSEQAQRAGARRVGLAATGDPPSGGGQRILHAGHDLLRREDRVTTCPFIGAEKQSPTPPTTRLGATPPGARGSARCGTDDQADQRHRYPIPECVLES